MMTSNEFLAWEEAQPDRYEYVDGEVIEMSGATRDHNVIVLNVAFPIRQHLKGTGCEVMVSTMKVRVAASNAFFYPDVVVTCSKRTDMSQRADDAPKLVIEVLSPSTRRHDQTVKLLHYQRIPALQEIAFIDPVLKTTQVHVRRADRLWDRRHFGQGEAVEFASIDLKIAADDLYAVEH